MLNRTSILLLLGAIALTGGVLLLEGQRDRTEPETTTPGQPSTAAATAGDPLFPFAEADVDSFIVERPDGLISFVKQADDTWTMTEPQSAPAEGGAVAFLLDQLTSTAIQTLSIDPATLSDFGLADPIATVELTADGGLHQFAVGNADYTGDKRYVQVIEADTPEETGAKEANPEESVTIHVVSGGILNAVNRPTADWLMADDDSSNGAEAENPPSKTD
ncbi:MAG: DUF4340 domain-containing protein [Phormidesmis sp.]